MKKIILAILIPVLIFIVTDFYNFISIAYDDNKEIKEKYDAIVVLTGGVGRIDTAIELMEKSKADILFISGVNKSVSLPSFKEANKINKNIEPKLGYIAENTYENALEIASFVSNNNISSIILVTSSYHIPRSMLEFSELNKKIKIKPFRVFADKENQKKWWSSFNSGYIVFTEYSKYLVTKIRKKIA